jgi:hypothetical protein
MRRLRDEEERIDRDLLLVEFAVAGQSQSAIARRLGLPRKTVADRLTRYIPADVRDLITVLARRFPDFIPDAAKDEARDLLRRHRHQARANTGDLRYGLTPARGGENSGNLPEPNHSKVKPPRV